jgi:small-conductance mechanosensitive channel
LILLFERPVKVGDTVQIGAHMGSLKAIGLRASIVRKVDGSDVIVPNSQLISEEVINWTMSDDRRRIDIPVGVAYGTDPHVVLKLLADLPVGREHILAEPPPRALFIGFGESSLDFELRFWTGESDGWVTLRSEMVTAVHDALIGADIEIPFPQRDLHIQGLEKVALEKLQSIASK